jgi:tetratricopeptide (TPR) repeat protein
VQLVAALARSGPVVIALDDLHWADDMSLRLLSFVARRISDALAVLLIVTARAEEMPEPLSRALDQLDREFPLLQITLTPLGREDTASLARALAARADEPPAVLAEAVWTASEGNPFIAIETLRALGEKAIAETPGGLQLPERVRRLIDARLDRLAPTSRELVVTAAVIGRDFEHGLLQEASGLTDGEAVAGLEELVRRRVFQPVGDQFDFSHDRIREVAYARLLPPRRKLLHRHVAEAIERMHGGALEPHYGVLGLHYYEAEVWDRATHFLELAGLEARQRAAYREAGALLQQALDALEREPPSEASVRRQIDLRLHLRRVLYPVADMPGLAENLARTRSLVATLSGDQSRRAVMRVYESEYLRSVRDLRGAVEAGEEGLALARQLGDQTLEFEARLHFGSALARQGRYRDAIAHLDAMGTSGRQHYPYAPGRATVVRLLVDLGEFGEARWRAERDLRIAEHVEHPVGLGEALIAIGRLELALGHATAASEHLARSLEIARKWEIAHQVPVSLTLLALACAAAGRISEADALIDEAERSAMWSHPRTPTIAGLAPFLTGRVDVARRLAIDGLDEARAAGARGNEAEARTLRGLLALRDAECGGSAIGFADAERWLREALAVAGALGMRPLEGHCHLGLARICRHLARDAEAKDCFTAATGMYRDLGMGWWLEQSDQLAQG